MSASPSRDFPTHDWFWSMVQPVANTPNLRRPFRGPGHFARARKARSLFTWTGIADQLVAAVEHRLQVAVVALDETDWDEPWNDGD